jgi:glycosyltransferase involved in cell wall biosynthesis
MAPTDPAAIPDVPPVSVVIPAYNRAATIRAAIESVLRQTWTDFELIVVDDGSTDGTLAAAAAVEDPRLRLVPAPRNLGAAGARNLGVAEARGRWIAFQDSDDEWLPGKLEKQMARLTAPGAAYVGAYCGLLTLGGLDDRAGERIRLRYVPDPSVAEADGAILTTLLRGNVISTQTLVVRRDLFLELGGFDEATTPIEDWDFVIRLAGRGPIAFVDEPLVHQRFSENSITRWAARRLASHERVVAKNQALWARHPDLLAWQHYVMAGDHRQAGSLAEARRHLGLARRSHPASPRPWAMSLYVAALSAADPFRAAAPPSR